MSEPAKDEAGIVEIMAKAHRERWRDREGVRAETLEWSDICGAEHLDSIALMEAALAAIRAAGWAVVPVEPTFAMRCEGSVAMVKLEYLPSPGEVESIYCAMIAAAPGFKP
jgi:hypothetical protein